MFRYFPVLVISLISLYTSAQVSNVMWSEEMKFRQGSTDFRIVNSDNTGFFLQESHQAMKTYFVIGYSVREVAKLVRLDKAMTEQYSNDYTKELKGKEFDRFLFIKDKLYIIADDYSKKDLQLTIYFAEINKQTGDLKGDWTPLHTVQAETKNQDIIYKFDYLSDSGQVSLVTSVIGKKANNYTINILDEKLSIARKYPEITNEFDPNTFVLEDITVAPSGQVMLLGRENEYMEGKKKKSKFLQFKNYNARIYGTDGRLIKELKTDSDSKFLVNSKLLVNKTDIVMASFYSTTRSRKEINGLVIFRVDPATGSIITSQSTELTKGMISDVEEDDEDGEKSSKKKDDDDDEGLSGRLVFRNFLVAPDNSLVFLAEKVRSYTVSSTSYSGTGIAQSARTTSSLIYECGDIYMAKIAASGRIDWFQTFPKFQRERHYLGTSTGSFPVTPSYFTTLLDKPLYAGFGVVEAKDKAYILFNDNRKNADVVRSGQKVKTLNGNYAKADCFSLELDLLTGVYKRKYLYSNESGQYAMPRFGKQFGNIYYLVGRKDRALGKTKVVVGKLTVK